MKTLQILTVAMAFGLSAPLLGAPASAEEEAPSEALALAAKIAELHKADDASGLVDAVKKAPEVHNATTDPAQKEAVQSALGKVLKDKKAGDARTAAVEALQGLDDKKGAWKQLSGAMPDPKLEESTDFEIAVLKAAGVVADERAIDPLFELVQKSKSNAIAREAATSLGGYVANKKKRVMILEELIGIGSRLVPSAGTKGVSKEAQERWAQVGGGIIMALNALTGQKLQDFGDWQALYRENKKTLKKLFKDEA